MIINWRLYPLVRVCLAFIVGIIVYNYFGNVGVLFTTALMAFASTLFAMFTNSFVKERTGYGIALLSFCAFLGASRQAVTLSIGDKAHVHNYIGKMDYCVVDITNIPSLKSRLVTSAKVKSIVSNGHTYEVKGGVNIYFPKNQLVAEVKPGDRLMIKSPLVLNKPSSNPHAFNYIEFLNKKGITHTVYLDDPSDYVIMSNRNLFLPLQWSIEIRQFFLEKFERYIESPDVRSVVGAIVLGHRDDMDQDLYEDFIDTGSVHILAVSGMHVKILTGILLFLLGYLIPKGGRWHYVNMISILVMIWLYGLMCGAAPSIIRACTMVSIYLLGRHIFGGAQAYNVMAASGLLLLMVDPLQLFQASFQFSYLALWSIVFFYPRLSKVYVSNNVWMNRIMNLTFVTIAANVLLFPATLQVYHKFPLYFILSGVFAVPLGTLLMVVSLLFCMSTLISGSVASLMAVIVSWVGTLFIGVVSGLNDLPMSRLEGLYIDKVELSILYLIIGALMLFLTITKKWTYFVMVFLIIVFTCKISMRNWDSYDQEKIIVYSVNKSSLIDVIDGRSCLIYKSPSLTATQVKYAAEANRHALNIEKTEDWESINADGVLDSELKSCNSIQTSRGWILNIMDRSANSYVRNADVYVFTDKCWIEPPEMKEVNTNARFVFDKSISASLVDKWKQALPTSEILYVGDHGITLERHK